MKSPRPRRFHIRAALAALSLILIASAAHAQLVKPLPPPPDGGGGPGPVSKEDRDSDGPFRTNQVMTRAVITSKPEPDYTAEARENAVYGAVRLRAVLTSKGNVADIRVIKGLSDGLTEKAIAAIRQVRFTPARRYGHAVSQYITLEYYFGLNDEDADKRVEILEQPRPEYTEEARKAGVAGELVVECFFHEDGTAEPLRVVEGLPGGLTVKALEAAQRIKFKPAEFKGRKVTVVRKVVYVFPPDAPAKQ